MEIKNFYKPYLEKYESKYRVLYHLLQQPSLIPTHDTTSGITPSLAALDDATSLKQREWIRSEPGEDIPCQYSSIEGHLTPNTLRSEDTRLEPSLNVTPEGSLVAIPTVVKRETREQVPERDLLGTSSETTYMEIPDTHAKAIYKSPTSGVPKSIQGTKEAITVDVELRGTSSPRISLPKGSPSHPTVTATCRPRTWMQQLTEGQTNEPRREDISPSESNTSVVETLPEDIPDELGHE